LDKRTRATLRKAEFGFLGVVVYTRVQTPRFCGHAFKAGTLFRFLTAFRDLRVSWLIVGIFFLFLFTYSIQNLSSTYFRQMKEPISFNKIIISY
jgi:hypothetical protein